MLLTLFSVNIAIGQSYEPYKVIQVGNLGEVEDSVVFASFMNHLDSLQPPFSVILNGDFYHIGNLDLTKTLAQWIQTRPSCRLILIQGDREWRDHDIHGWQQSKIIEKEITSWNFPNVFWLNKNGCPGPEVITLDNQLVLVGVNTQWFNHPYAKPTQDSEYCDIADEDDFMEALEEIVDEHSDQNILIAGHYPIRSAGPYGGAYPTKDWILPVPIYSGFKTSYKKHVGSSTEINNEHFQDFKNDMLDYLLAQHTIIYASGHEYHSEIQRLGNNYLINSGNISKGHSIQPTKYNVLAANSIGFIELTYVPNGKVHASYFAFDAMKFKRDEERILFQAPCESPIPSIPENQRFVPCVFDLPVLESMVDEHPQTMKIAANENYAKSRVGRLLLGNHYRNSWAKRIAMNTLQLDTFAGGLTPYARGGGSETESLKLFDTNKKEYVFRSVDKDPSSGLSYDLRNTVIDFLIQDQTTRQQPYGAIAIPPLMDKINLLHATPQLFVMPDDAKLGPWQRDFGGMVGLLEERPSNHQKEKFAEADEISRTVRMIRKMTHDRDNRIKTDEYVRARLFDMLIGDWSRDENNWKWAGYKHQKGLEFRPIARDRDHAFSKSDGALPWLADREWAKSAGEHFGEDVKGIRSLNYQSRHMDRFLLSEVDKKTWIDEAKYIQEQLTDGIIDQAMSRLDSMANEEDKKEIVRKLKIRNKNIVTYAEKYYDILAKEVDIVGSNKHEYFDVQRLRNGDVLVNMYKIRKKKRDIRYYSRLFKYNETKEIRLFGLDGKDVFHIAGEAPKSIKLRIIPGMDRDSIIDQSRVKKIKRATRTYIPSYDIDYVESNGEVKNDRHAAEWAYDYNRTSFQYDTYFPIVYLFYNSANGFEVRARLTFTNHKYGKDKFSSKHKIKFRTTTLGNFAVEYIPRWNNVIGDWDIIGQLEYENSRNYNFFFGKGQGAKYDKTRLDNDYYSLQYSRVGGSLGLSKEFWRHAELSGAFKMYYNTEQKRQASIAQEFPNVRGLKSNFNTHLELKADLDLRDNTNLPRSGYRFLVDSKIGTDLKSEEGSFVSAVATMEMFHTARRLTIGLRSGAAMNGGDVPYFFLQTMGRNNYLRGFRQNRFFGDQNLFFNGEVRYEIIHQRATTIPIQFGLKLFCDTGRFFLNGTDNASSNWFTGYGGGIYIVPYKERFTLNLVAGFSREEKLLFQFRLGKPF